MTMDKTLHQSAIARRVLATNLRVHEPARRVEVTAETDARKTYLNTAAARLARAREES